MNTSITAQSGTEMLEERGRFFPSCGRSLTQEKSTGLGCRPGWVNIGRVDGAAHGESGKGFRANCLGMMCDGAKTLRADRESEPGESGTAAAEEVSEMGRKECAGAGKAPASPSSMRAAGKLPAARETGGPVIRSKDKLPLQIGHAANAQGPARAFAKQGVVCGASELVCARTEGPSNRSQGALGARQGKERSESYQNIVAEQTAALVIAAGETVGPTPAFMPAPHGPTQANEDVRRTGKSDPIWRSGERVQESAANQGANPDRRINAAGAARGTSQAWQATSSQQALVRPQSMSDRRAEQGWERVDEMNEGHGGSRSETQSILRTSSAEPPLSGAEAGGRTQLNTGMAAQPAKSESNDASAEPSLGTANAARRTTVNTFDSEQTAIAAAGREQIKLSPGKESREGTGRLSAHATEAVQPAGSGVKPPALTSRPDGMHAISPEGLGHGPDSIRAAATDLSESQMRETLAAADSGAGVRAPNWIHAGPLHAEAGFEDPALGWVGVRAELNAGGVHASLVPGSAEAAQVLGAHLRGLGDYLAEQRAPVTTLTLDADGRGSAGSGAGQEMLNGGGQDTGGDAATRSHSSVQGNAREFWQERAQIAANEGGGVAHMANLGPLRGIHVSVMA
jgi:hypothetical protein